MELSDAVHFVRSNYGKVCHPIVAASAYRGDEDVVQLAEFAEGIPLGLNSCVSTGHGRLGISFPQLERAL